MAFRYTAGIVNHHSYRDLSRCIESLQTQTMTPSVIVVIDHDPDPKAQAELRREYPELVIEAGPNLGFAAGANRALASAEVLDPEAEYRMLLNADIELECDFASALIREMSARPDVALASGKLLRQDGRTLDSAGITMDRSRRTSDRGSEQVDRGQFGRIERVFAVSGAALLIRNSAVASLRVEGELFDEDFFAYREETDLAWRAHLFGWSCLYVPQARAAHRRGWTPSNWREIDQRIRRHSFKNRYLEMIKNERASEFFRDLPAILAWEGMRFGYALLRDPSRIPAYSDAVRLSGRAWTKRRLIQRRAAESGTRRLQLKITSSTRLGSGVLRKIIRRST